MGKQKHVDQRVSSGWRMRSHILLWLCVLVAIMVAIGFGWSLPIFPFVVHWGLSTLLSSCLTMGIVMLSAMTIYAVLTGLFKWAATAPDYHHYCCGLAYASQFGSVLVPVVFMVCVATMPPPISGLLAISLMAPLVCVVLRMIYQCVLNALLFEVCSTPPHGQKGDEKYRARLQCMIALGADINATNTFGNSLLHLASLAGDVDMVKSLLEKGADLRVINLSGQSTPLYFAVQKGAIEVVKILLAHGDAVNRMTWDGISPLVFAIHGGHVGMAKLLIAHGADANKGRIEKKIPIQWAIENNLMEIAGQLVEKGADLNIFNEWGETLLQQAVRMGQIEQVKFLVDHGADLNVTRHYNPCALVRALWRLDFGMASLLIAHGASLNAANSADVSLLHLLFNERFFEWYQNNLGSESKRALSTMLVQYHANDGYGSKTLLEFGLEKGPQAIAQLMVEHGAYFEKKIGRGRNFLRTAIKNRCIEMACLLIQHGANVDTFTDGDTTNRSPLQYVARRGYISVAKMLIEYGAVVNSKSFNGYESPLCTAIESKHIEIVKMLIAHGADVHQCGHSQKTPLHFASKIGDEQVIQMLIKRGATMDVFDADGNHPLCIAAQGYSVNVAKLLIEAGADVNLAGQDGQRPLHFAALSRNRGMIKILMEFGADVHAVDRYGKTALDAFDLRLLSEMHPYGADACNMLVEYGAMVRKSKQSIGWGLTYISVLLGSTKMVSVQIQRGENLNFPLRDGSTLLHVAVKNRQYRMVRFLIESGARVNAVDLDHMTPLHCCGFRDIKMMKLLIAYGADVNARDLCGNTPLHYAKERFDELGMTMLIQNGASVFSKNNDGRGALNLPSAALGQRNTLSMHGFYDWHPIFPVLMSAKVNPVWYLSVLSSPDSQQWGPLNAARSLKKRQLSFYENKHCPYSVPVGVREVVLCVLMCLQRRSDVAHSSSEMFPSVPFEMMDHIFSNLFSLVVRKNTPSSQAHRFLSRGRIVDFFNGAKAIKPINPVC